MTTIENSSIQTTGADLRSITGWTSVDFVGDADEVFVFFDGSAQWTDQSGHSHELGTLSACQLAAISA